MQKKVGRAIPTNTKAMSEWDMVREKEGKWAVKEYLLIKYMYKLGEELETTYHQHLQEESQTLPFRVTAYFP